MRGSGRPAEAEMEARVKALLDASARVFIEHGFSDASYEMIAKEANVSTKTIYAWFGGKAGLFAAVVERYAKRIEPQLHEVLTQNCEHPEIALAQAARIILSFELEPELLAVHRAVIAASAKLPEIGSTFYALGPGRGVEILAVFLERCHEKRLLSVDNFITAAEAFMALISRGVLARYLVRAEQGFPSSEMLERQIRPALAMFLAAHRVPVP